MRKDRLRFNRLPILLALFMLLAANFMPHHHHVPGLACLETHCTHGAHCDAESSAHGHGQCLETNCPVHSPYTLTTETRKRTATVHSQNRVNCVAGVCLPFAYAALPDTGLRSKPSSMPSCFLPLWRNAIRGLRAPPSSFA